MAALQKEQAQAAAARYLPGRTGGFLDVTTGKYPPGLGPAEKEGNPDQQTYDYLQTTPNPDTGRPYTPAEATQKIAQMKQDTRPDKAPNRDDEAIRIYTQEAKAANPKLTPDQAYTAGYKRWVDQTKVQPGLIRAEGFAVSRGPIVTDTQTGISAPMNWSDYNKKSAAEPGRYVASQYDPEVKGALASAQAVGRDMPTQVRSFGQFIGHAADLSKAVDNLRNMTPTFINRPVNWLKKNATGNTAIINYLAKVEPVRKEFESFLINNRALTVDDRAQGQEVLNENSSPAQMQAAIKSFMHTALVRLNELNQTYYTQTGQDYPGLLSPQASKVMEDFGFGTEVKAFRARGMIGGTTSKRPGAGAQPAASSSAPQSSKYAPGFNPL